jgi:hypothetical protein
MASSDNQGGQIVPTTSEPNPDQEMANLEPSEGSERRRMRQAQEFFNQVRQALAEFQSLRGNLEQAGHSVNELGDRLINDEQYLAAELTRQRDQTQGAELEAQVGRRHAESLEERLGIFQKSLQEAHRLRGDQITQVALESVRQGTRLAVIENQLATLPEALQQLSSTQNTTLRTLNEIATTQNSIGQVVREQGQWIRNYERDLDSENQAARADAIEKGARRLAKKTGSISEKAKAILDGRRNRRYRQPTVEPDNEDDQEEENPRTVSPQPVPSVHFERELTPPLDNPAVMQGASPSIDDLRRQLRQVTQQRDFYQGALGGGAPPSKPPIYTVGAPGDPGDSDGEGNDDNGQPRRQRAPPGRYPLGQPMPQPVQTLTIAPQQKDTPCANPPKFAMKRNEDYRPYLKGCKRFIDLMYLRFPDEKSKIRWAISFLEGDKATTWGSSYEESMLAREGGYRSNWDVYEEALIEHCSSPFDEQRAVRQMYNWKYTGDVSAYIDKLKFFNIQAKLSGGGLRDAVMRGLSSELIKSMSLLGRARTDEELWALLERAGEGVEDIERQQKDPSQGTGGSSGKRNEKKRTRSEEETPKTGGSSGEKKRRTSERRNDRSTNPGMVIQAGETDWSKKHAGIQQGLIDRRRKERKCTRCEGDHLWKDCTKSNPVVSSLKKDKKDGRKNQPEKAQASTMHVPVPKVSSARIMAVDSDDNMSDYS